MQYIHLYSCFSNFNLYTIHIVHWIFIMINISPKSDFFLTQYTFSGKGGGAILTCPVSHYDHKLAWIRVFQAEELDKHKWQKFPLVLFAMSKQLLTLQWLTKLFARVYANHLVFRSIESNFFPFFSLSLSISVCLSLSLIKMGICQKVKLNPKLDDKKNYKRKDFLCQTVNLYHLAVNSFASFFFFSGNGRNITRS